MKTKNRVVVIFLTFLSLYLGISCSLLTANTKKPSQGNTHEANTQNNTILLMILNLHFLIQIRFLAAPMPQKSLHFCLL